MVIIRQNIWDKELPLPYLTLVVALAFNPIATGVLPRMYKAGTSNATSKAAYPSQASDIIDIGNTQTNKVYLKLV